MIYQDSLDSIYSNHFYKVYIFVLNLLKKVIMNVNYRFWEKKQVYKSVIKS